MPNMPLRPPPLHLGHVLVPAVGQSSQAEISQRKALLVNCVPNVEQYSHDWINILAHIYARSVLLSSSLGSTNFSTKGNTEATKQPLKKPKLPVGRFDESEESTMEKEPLEKFPDGINPVTKERGGPKGPEPTRYGDWERKGRCIDF